MIILQKHTEKNLFGALHSKEYIFNLFTETVFAFDSTDPAPILPGESENNPLGDGGSALKPSPNPMLDAALGRREDDQAALI